MSAFEVNGGTTNCGREETASAAQQDREQKFHYHVSNDTFSFQCPMWCEAQQLFLFAFTDISYGTP